MTVLSPSRRRGAGPRRHAVVLGGSMAGLLVARVLSDSFEKVTLVERDDLSSPGDRPGVPQGRHVHALLARGQQIVEELFPGITAELLADGAVACRSMSEARMSVYGHTLHRADAGYSLLQASRPFLEWRVRSRVRSLPNVEVLDRCEVTALRADAGGRVTGVRVVQADAAGDLPADLTVSCLGRHGPVNAWLAQLGYERPAEEGVRIDMKYASRYVRLPDGALQGDKEIVIADREPARGLALFAVEDGRHILTLIGYGEDHPPTDEDGYWRFAASVAPPDVRAALVAAEPVSAVQTYRYLANQRRRYERLARFPAGLLVAGDAVCSFSPAFGQGMTMSALQAVELRRVLADGDHDLARRWFRAAAGAIDVAWAMTRLFDLAMPHVGGARLRSRVLGAGAGLVMAVGERDAGVGRQLARIAGLVDRPVTALHPVLIVRAAAAVSGLGLQATAGALPGLRTPAATLPAFDPTPLTRAAGVHRLRVRSVVPDTPDSVVIEFDVPPALQPRYSFAAGQHVVVHGSCDARAVRRSYSLCDPAGSGRLRIAVRRQDGGLFSTFAVQQLSAGMQLHVSEPAGSFVAPPGDGRRYCAVAAGSGITPLLSIIATTLATEPASTVQLHYGSRDREHVMLGADLRRLARRYPERLRIVHHLSRSGPPGAQCGEQWRSGRVQPADVAGQDADLWLLCGPRELVAEVRRALVERGVDGSRVLVELFETRQVGAAPVGRTATSRVTLRGSGVDLAFDAPRGAPVLDAALDLRTDLPYACLGGSCGTCLALVEDGELEMSADPLLAISDGERAAGYVLACQARPVTDAVALRFAR